MQTGIDISRGQREARTRWGTHESGAEFDRNKHPFLTEEAREFIRQQGMCVLAGADLQGTPCGLLIMEQPNFVAMPDMHTCFLPINQQYAESPVVRGVCHALASGSRPHLALCFVQHATRQRICVRGEGNLVSGSFGRTSWLRLDVELAFSHCSSYICPQGPGLHVPGEKTTPPFAEQAQDRLTEDMRAFLARQVSCYLCTSDRRGRCAVNYRGGPAGFLVTMEPDKLTPGGIILLPDYAGNGAFEAIGNILETEKAALLVPSYAEQFALCISGEATVLEPTQLPLPLRKQCHEAQRVVALAVTHIERQSGDWSEVLAYERARAKSFVEAPEMVPVCSVW